MGRNSSWVLALVCAGCAWDWDAVDRAIHPPLHVPDADVAADGGPDAAQDGASEGGEPDVPDSAIDAGHDARMPDQPTPDADIELPDADVPPDDDAGDPLYLLGCEAEDRALGSAAIAEARAAEDGGVAIDVEHVRVTNVRQALGNDPSGFFVQAEAQGPALFVSVNPAALDPRPQAGDCVSFRITAMETTVFARHVAAIASYEVIGTGHDLTDLIQDLSAATDVVDNAAAYEHELVAITGTLSGCETDVTVTGDRHSACRVLTVGIPTLGFLWLRTPTTLADALDLDEGCAVSVDAAPLWRRSFFGSGLYEDPSIEPRRAEELVVSGCPAPNALDAVSIGPDTIRVRFDRQIAASSVESAGTQLAIAGGLTVTGAALSPAGATRSRTLLVTTTVQTPGEIYDLSIEPTLADTSGTALASAALFELRGYGPPAGIAINETGYDGCGFTELRVLESGSMDGFTLTNHRGLIETFDRLYVEKNDYVVFRHCRGSDQYSMPNELPSAVYERYTDADANSTGHSCGRASCVRAASCATPKRARSTSCCSTAMRSSRSAALHRGLCPQWPPTRTRSCCASIALSMLPASMPARASSSSWAGSRPLRPCSATMDSRSRCSPRRRCSLLRTRSRSMPR
jgi:hypothetical protein